MFAEPVLSFVILIISFQGLTASSCCIEGSFHFRLGPCLDWMFLIVVFESTCVRPAFAGEKGVLRWTMLFEEPLLNDIVVKFSLGQVFALACLVVTAAEDGCFEEFAPGYCVAATSDRTCPYGG